MPAGTQISSFDIYDGLLRPRQTQTTAPDAKRTVTDTVYDGRGLVAKTSPVYNGASGPTSTLYSVADTAVESQHRFAYDGLDRQLSDKLYSLNVFKWETLTSYGGDRVSVDPPVGGTPTTSIVDARGRQTALWQYTGAGPSGTHEDTAYVYDDADRLTRVTDGAGNDWDYTYDLRGRRISSVDPDAGTSSSTYDDAGRLCCVG